MMLAPYFLLIFADGHFDHQRFYLIVNRNTILEN
jgi:hypothetical protein